VSALVDIPSPTGEDLDELTNVLAQVLLELAREALGEISADGCHSGIHVPSTVAELPGGEE
jgi:hypothetical protein